MMLVGTSGVPQMTVDAQSVLSDRIRSSNRLKPVKTYKEMLKADVRRLQTNPESLGLSAAQRKQMVSEATEAAGSQRRAQMEDLAQMALAGQGFQQGAFSQAQRDVVEGAAQDAASAAQKVNDLNRRIIDAEKSRIRAELDAARGRARDDARFWAQFGLDSAATLVQAAGGAL